jgi:transcriptional regulator with PAS, ATPase and Fis domain
MPGTVLITGETGTGKELVARAIHAESTRCDRPFVVFNCVAATPSLMEQELFGHVPGAFPGATAVRPGLIEHAHTGTMFLDEVGFLVKESQARLLAVLESGMARRLGENEGRPVDVRFVAATNSDLSGAVERGTFRHDLFYRLNVYHVRLPPLRDRPGDVEQLIAHFLRKYSPFEHREVDEDAMRALVAYRYPGNVRELEHTIQRAVALAQGRPIHVSDLAETVAVERPSGEGAQDRGVAAARDRAERAMILEALATYRGDMNAVARALQVSRTTLWRLLRKHNIRGHA